MRPPGANRRSPLRTPDDERWRRIPGYLPELGRALRYSYGLLNQQTYPDRFFIAYAVLVPFRHRLLCAEQRLRLEYALTLSYAGENAIDEALDCLDRAIDVASATVDWAAIAELDFMAGVLCSSRADYSEAYDRYSGALFALRQLERNGIPADPTFELDLVIRLGWRAWELGQFPLCLRRLDEAHELRARWASDAVMQAASLTWLDAQLWRVRGKPLRAFTQMSAAADLVARCAGPIDVGRANTILAECALDIAEDQATWAGTQSSLAHLAGQVGAIVRAGPEALLMCAQVAASQATQVSQQAEDPIGAAMARIVHARCDRQRGASDHEQWRQRTNEDVIRVAQREADASLLGRAMTARGDELRANGHIDAARVAYRNALHLLEEHDLRGLALWPRRALASLSADGA